MRIYLAGHGGMVGSAIWRQLQARGGDEVITRSRADLDLTDQAAVQAFLRAERVDAVILAAAKVGGIHANATYPADFIYDNLMIAANVINAAHHADVQHLLQLGSSCIYPRDAPQPMAEDALLTGPLEPTNAPYAIAKIAAIKLCESYNLQHGRDYRSVMPTNLYGPGDSFHPDNSHVLPALIGRFHAAHAAGAESVAIWGSGTPKREFMHVNDMAAASLYVMDLSAQTYRGATAPACSHVNVGTGRDVSIADLARMVAAETGFEGEITFDTTRPDGAPRKLLDVGLLTGLGWQAQITLEEGLRDTYAWYLHALDQGLRGR